MSETLGKNIRAQRRALDITQKELREQVGVSRGYISLLEKGFVKNPSYTKIVAIAKALKTTPEFLFNTKKENDL